MVLARGITRYRTVARTCAAVLFAALLQAAPASAIPMPDSAGFARLEHTAGASGHAHLMVRWQERWFELRKAEYDSAGIHGGVREVQGPGLSSDPASPADRRPMSWGEIEQLRVPASHVRPIAPWVGAGIGMLVGAGLMVASSSEATVTSAQLAGTSLGFGVLGVTIGTVIYSVHHGHQPGWVDF